MRDGGCSRRSVCRAEHTTRLRQIGSVMKSHPDVRERRDGYVAVTWAFKTAGAVRRNQAALEIGTLHALAAAGPVARDRDPPLPRVGREQVTEPKRGAHVGSRGRFWRRHGQVK